MNEKIDNEVGENVPNLLEGFYRTDVMLRLSVFQFHLKNNNPNNKQVTTKTSYNKRKP